MPACGVRPEAIANAIARGNATRPTVTPASRSSRNLCRSYVRRNKTDFGSQLSLRKPLPIFSLSQPHRGSGSDEGGRPGQQLIFAPLPGRDGETQRRRLDREHTQFFSSQPARCKTACGFTNWLIYRSFEYDEWRQEIDPKSSFVNRAMTASCDGEHRKWRMVEAAGVEPASENVTGQEPTCVVAFLPQALPWDVRGRRSERTRNANR